MAELIGKTIGNKYKIEERLGRGGMAEVYKAHQAHLDRQVAIKIIHAFLAEEPEYLGRFQREAKSVAALRHPHIVQVFDYDIENGMSYMVMEYVAGKTLKEKIARHRQQNADNNLSMPLAESLPLIQQIGSALAYAHERDMIHRDIKPANVLIGSDGRAILTDFGIAKILSGTQYTATGASVGTPAYMAPEQATGGRGDHRADIYSFGILMFEMVTGKPPFSGENAYEIILKHISDPPPSPIFFNNSVPLWLNDVILRALAKEPEKRYQTMAQLLGDMQVNQVESTAILPAFSPEHDDTNIHPITPPDPVTLAPNDFAGERDRLVKAIAALETQRTLLGDEIVNSGIAPLRSRLAGLEPATVTEQRKQVTVFSIGVTLLNGMTDLADQLDPEDWRDLMTQSYRQWSNLITQFGGTAERTLDGKVLGIFGAPIATEADPENAIRAALAIRDNIDDLRKMVDMDDLEVQIGVNTGATLVSLLGGQHGETVTVVGNTVNLVYSLRHQAQPGEILISTDTYKLVRGVFEVEKRMVQLRGTADPTPVLAVQWEKPTAFRLQTRGIEGIQTRMVGRDAELRRLQDSLLDASDYSELQIVTIVGEAGVGKSRLLDEFDKWLKAESANPQIFWGRATAHTTHQPFGLFRDLFAHYFNILDSDSSDVARDKFIAGIRATLGNGIEKSHFVGYLLGFDFADSVYLRGILNDPEQIRDRAWHYIADIFRVVSETAPVIIYLDDIHWADDASLDLIDWLVKICANVPLFVVALTRPDLYERRKLWGEGRKAYSRIDITPLSRRDLHRLVAQILQKMEHIPDSLREFIMQGAEGNPFYVEELIILLMDDGVIEANDEKWQVNLHKLSTVKVPASLTEVIQARLDALPADAREALQRASVVGRTFWDELLAKLEPASSMDAPHRELPANLQALLRGLRQREWVLGREHSAFANANEYAFRHAISRDVTYEGVLKRVRRVYHKQVGAWLAEQSSDRVAEFAGRIAKHFELGGAMAEAGRWHAQAGDQARATFVLKSAIGHYESALTYLPDDDPIRITTHENLAQVFLWRLRMEDAGIQYQHALKFAQNQHDSAGQARAYLGLAEVALRQGDLAGCLKYAEDAGIISHNGQPEYAKSLFWQGWTKLRMGELDKAVQLGQQALAIYRQLDQPADIAASLNLLGSAAGTAQNLDESDNYFAEAREILQGLGDLRKGAIISNNLGANADRRGDFAGAVSLFREAMANHQKLGAHEQAALAEMNVGVTLLKLGAYGEAEEVLAGLVEKMPAQWFRLPIILRGLAQAKFALGNPTAALPLAQQAVEQTITMQLNDKLPEAWQTLADILTNLSTTTTINGETLSATDCLEKIDSIP